MAKPDFSKNTEYTPEYNFDSVVWGAHSPITEKDINEAQKIQSEKLKQLLFGIVGDGVMGNVSFDDGLLSIIDAVIVIGGNIINVDKLQLNLQEGEEACIELWYEIVNKDSTIYKNGNLQAEELENYIHDLRYELEITKRVQILFNLVKTQDVKLNSFKLVLGSVDNGNFVKSYNDLNTLCGLVNEMAETKKFVSDGKSAVASAITSMGVSTVSDATFKEIGNSIKKITPVILWDRNIVKASNNGNNEVQSVIDAYGNTVNDTIIYPGKSDTILFTKGSRKYMSSDIKIGSLGGNVTQDKVLTGNSFSSNSAGRNIAGTMPDNGAVSKSLTCGGAYTIPKGYHNGNGKVTANSLSSQTQANSSSDDIKKDKTAYVNGNKVTGTMPDNGAVSKSLSINGSYTIPKGYHNGNGKVTQSVATQGAQIITPGTSDKYISSGRYLTGKQTIKGDANLVPENIIQGKTIFGVSGSASQGIDIYDITNVERYPYVIGTFVNTGGSISNAYTHWIGSQKKSSRPYAEWGVDFGQYRNSGFGYIDFFVNISGKTMSSYGNLKRDICFYFDKYYTSGSKRDFNDDWVASELPDYASLSPKEFPGLDISNEDFIVIVTYCTWGDLCSTPSPNESVVTYFILNSDTNNNRYDFLKEAFNVKFSNGITLNLQFEQIKGVNNNEHTRLVVRNFGSTEGGEDYFNFEIAKVSRIEKMRLSSIKKGSVA